jgi:ribosomal protein L36
VEEFEIIEPSAIDQLGNSWLTPDGEEVKKKQRQLEEEAGRRQSPRTKARQRWRNAIKQQIMLNKMDKNNKLVQRKGKFEVKGKNKRFWRMISLNC